MKVIVNMDNTSSIYRILKSIFFSLVEGFERILIYRNIKTGQLTKRHNLCPWEFQRTVGRSDSPKLQRYAYEAILGREMSSDQLWTCLSPK